MRWRPAGGRLRCWVSRLCAVVTGAVLLLFVRAQTAAAAPVVIAAGKVGQTPAALAWIQLKDSRGISMWNYEMSLDRGGLTRPDKFFWASITDTSWGFYRAVCALALWFLDWVLSFEWVSTIASPLREVGAAMQSVVTRVGIVPTLLTVTAAIAAFSMMRGKWATGLWELGMALVIAALASGVFAQPVEKIAGPNGYVVKANQTGQQLAAELATGDSQGKTPEQLRAAQTGQLVDTFIRLPTQMINFGRVLDGGKCEYAYNEVIKGGPYGNDKDIRSAIGDCDDALGGYADQPTASMALGSVVFMPAAFVILFMAIVLAGSVIAAGIWAMFQSLKMVVTFVTGLLPGGGRGSLLLTAAETLISLLIIVFTSVFLSVFLLVIQSLFKGSAGDAVPKTFVMADVLIVVGLAVYWRQRKRLRASSERVAQWMAQRPGGGAATRLPDRQGGLSIGPAASAVRTATGLAQLRAQRAAASGPGMAGPTFIDARQQAAFFGVAPRRRAPVTVDGEVVRDPSSPGVRGQLPGGGSRPAIEGGGSAQQPAPNSPGPRPGGGGAGARVDASRRNKMAGALVRAGTNAALASVTGGASTVVTGAASAARPGRAVNTARRAALTSRLALPAGGSSSPGGRGPLPMPSGGSSPAALMPLRTNAAPAPGGARDDRPSAGRVISGEVVSAKLAAIPGKTAAAALAGKTPAAAGKPPAGTSTPTPAPSPAQRPSAKPKQAPAAPAPGRARDDRPSAGRVISGEVVSAKLAAIPGKTAAAALAGKTPAAAGKPPAGTSTPIPAPSPAQRPSAKPAPADKRPGEGETPPAPVPAPAAPRRRDSAVRARKPKAAASGRAE